MEIFNPIYLLISLFKILPLQIKVQGMDEAAQQGVLFNFLVGIIIILGGVIGVLWYELKQKSKKTEEIQKTHLDSIKQIQDKSLEGINEIRETYTSLLENRHQEFNKKEEERNKQFLENEKETLKVLNGVTSILDVSEKMTDANNKQVMDRLDSLEKIIIEKINNINDYEA
jgi:hypothetical protein